jgi:hypothetical protein
MSPFRFGKRRVIGGITAVALGCGLLGASAVLAAGPPTANPSVTGGHLLVGCAFSWVNSQQSVHSVPVAIGVDPSKAFVTPPTAQPLACTP